ncbi:MAG: Uma2 family endonuclease [Gemmataceae bacterium]
MMTTLRARTSGKNPTSLRPPEGTLEWREPVAVIPSSATTFEGFRAWVRSDDFPRRGRYAFLGEQLWVDLSLEALFTHHQIKGEFASVLTGIVKAESRGYYFHDRTRYIHPAARLSTEPDGMFVRFAAEDDGDVEYFEGEDGTEFEVVGSADMTLEVVSASSARKDTVDLVDRYYRAGVREYWLVDPRGDTLLFDILTRGPKGFVRMRKQSGGWMKSAVFGRSFRLTQSPDPKGRPSYALETRP